MPALLPQFPEGLIRLSSEAAEFSAVQTLAFLTSVRASPWLTPHFPERGILALCRWAGLARRARQNCACPVHADTLTLCYLFLCVFKTGMLCHTSPRAFMI